MKDSIKDTSKKQREEMVKGALAISIVDAIPPSEKATKLVKEYVDGKKELADVQKEIVALYKK